MLVMVQLSQKRIQFNSVFDVVFRIRSFILPSMNVISTENDTMLSQMVGILMYKAQWILDSSLNVGIMLALSYLHCGLGDSQWCVTHY